ncbi:FkbM family methyltransferase [Aliiroseovarius subalbicans]|uniref:FkbM family methyltransferase n=1 Tax=Aliiroseovarius subalbicans TaxID=2925840 RepID=UPI001F5707A8|nr:FkbM family methyltransferase [Aliiroseovarius subalbicans]MCI2400022.1 FkbM family methyltransferase [Aliiroseovarius subalbicans]
MQTAVAENTYGRYSVPENLDHRPAVRLIKAGEVYEPQTIRFMAQHAGDGDIIHAGTFFGDFLPGLSSAMAPGRKIWGFEPNPDSFHHARKTAKLNGLKNVKIQNFALSNNDGEILFKTRDDAGNPMGGHSHFVTDPGPGVETVAAVRLDKAVGLKRKISLLQLDVEGHERAALLGAEEIIHTWRPILVLEEFKRPRWLRLNFGGLGYRLVGRLHGNRIFATHDMDVHA